jgi:hypothetical protein
MTCGFCGSDAGDGDNYVRQEKLTAETAEEAEIAEGTRAGARGPPSARGSPGLCSENTP